MVKTIPISAVYVSTFVTLAVFKITALANLKKNLQITHVYTATSFSIAYYHVPRGWLERLKIHRQ